MQDKIKNVLKLMSYIVWQLGPPFIILFLIITILIVIMRLLGIKTIEPLPWWPM